MRLDKFLKAARLIKRRTVSRAFCDAGRITVDGRAAKAGHRVEVGQELEIDFGGQRLKVRVLGLKDNPRASEVEDLYEVLE